MPKHKQHNTSHTSCFGVLGGSFDPPHYGHLALAETARVQLGLSRVLFVPAGLPPHKQGQELSKAEHRADMVQAAIADNPSFSLSRVDLDRPGPHFTVDMLELLCTQYTSVGEWFFLMGEDSLHDLPLWREAEKILRQVRIAVMPRLGKRVDVDELQRQIPALTQRLVWLDMPYLDISASVLRERVRKGLPLRYLVPSSVAEYIEEHGMYR